LINIILVVEGRYVPRFERSRGTVAFAATNTALSLGVAGRVVATRDLVEETLNLIERFVIKDAHAEVLLVVVGQTEVSLCMLVYIAHRWYDIMPVRHPHLFSDQIISCK
jgi:hypothetical protein